MATSGVGRGRGWLNLTITAPIRPGNQEPTMNYAPETPTNFSPASPSPCYQPHAKLISLLNQLNIKDDGIIMNQKFKCIIETWTQECTTGNEVEDSCNYIYQKCLEDEVFASKIVTMVSSYTFKTTEICQQKIRNLFIGNIQMTFEGRKELQMTKPTMFHVAVKMLSEFYSKSRLTDGRPMRVFAMPLVCYLEMLLDSAQPADLELFTTQLYLNGSSIKADYAEKLGDLLNTVRLVLICNVQLTQTCKLFLLLAVDVANNRFGLLPTEIHKFYQEQLGDKIMAHFQGSLRALSIETQQSSKTLDGYQSNINVLQVTPPDSTSPVNEMAQNMSTKSYTKQLENSTQSGTKPPQGKFLPPQTQTYGAQNFSSDPINVNTWEGVKDGSGREKTGRPILGAGARFQKAKGDEAATWRERQESENSAGWNGRQKNWIGDKKGPSKSFNKGWEHDDRFENEYN